MEEFEVELKKSTLDELEDTLIELTESLDTKNIASIELDAIFRSAHSIKGNSKAADFDSISNITHLMEDLLIKKKNSESDVSESFYRLLLSFTDQLQNTIELLKKDISHMPNFDDLEEEIISFEETNSEPKYKEASTETNENEYKKLLLIDDDIDIYNIISKFLAHSFEIDYVSSAVQAIEDCKIEDYDLIICDYKMPVMNGQEFALYLRQGSSKNKETPMIFLTSYSPKLFNQKSIWEDVYFMDKPIDIRRLKYYSKCALVKSDTKMKAS